MNELWRSVRAVAKVPYRRYNRLRHPRFSELKTRTGGMMPVRVYRRLHELAADLPDLDIVEIGAGTGTGTIALAWGMAESGKTSSLVTVEKCEGGSRDEIGDYEANRRLLDDNFGWAGVADRIRLFPRLLDDDSIDDCRDQLTTDRLAALVIDADGRLDRDFRYFWSSVVEGGAIVVDDYKGRHPKAVLTRRLLDQMTTLGLFEPVAVVGETAFGRRPMRSEQPSAEVWAELTELTAATQR